jgi:glycosyltransferase involved in cell wall biosynthesis
VSKSLLPTDGIAFFMPVHNEEHNIVPVVEGLLRYFGRHSFRDYAIILVDDGSTDGSGAKCDELVQRYREHVSVEHHLVNQGYGAALKTGLGLALKTGSPWIGFFDSDDQFRPLTSLHRLVAEVLEHDQRQYSGHIDAAVGHRIQRADGLKRHLTGRMWHHVSLRVLPHEAHDVDCGCKLFRREAIADIVPCLQGQYATTSAELMARLYRNRARVVNVPVKHYPRTSGHQSGLDLQVISESFRSLWQVARVLKQSELRSTRTVVPVPQLFTSRVPEQRQEVLQEGGRGA